MQEIAQCRLTSQRRVEEISALQPGIYPELTNTGNHRTDLIPLPPTPHHPASRPHTSYTSKYSQWLLSSSTLPPTRTFSSSRSLVRR